MTASSEFQAFQRSVEGHVGSFQALESFDLVALQGIREEEKPHAVALLRRHSRQDDPRIVSALLTLGTEDAWGLLMELLTGGPSMTVATAAHRVWEQRNSPEALGALRRCLESSNEEVKSLALRIAGRVDAPVLDLLKGGLYAPEFESRVAAVNALYERYDLENYNNIVGSRVFHLALGVGSHMELMWRDSADSLCKMFEELDGGATPSSLGLVVSREQTRGPVRDLVGALLQTTEPLDPSLLIPLTPDEKDYAVEFLSKAITRGDFRVLPLLEALGTDRAKLALTAAQTGSE